MGLSGVKVHTAYCSDYYNFLACLANVGTWWLSGADKDVNVQIYS